MIGARRSRDNASPDVQSHRFMEENDMDLHDSYVITSADMATATMRARPSAGR